MARPLYDADGNVIGEEAEPGDPGYPTKTPGGDGTRGSDEPTSGSPGQRETSREELEDIIRRNGTSPDPSSVDAVLSGRMTLQDFINRQIARGQSGQSPPGTNQGAAPAPARSSSWFAANAPSPNFGAPNAFGETYSALARPDWLQGEFKAPTWTEQFVAPDAAALQNDPGYQARLEASQRGFERSAASRGSVLSGGFVGRTLPRALQAEASQEYGNAFKRAYDTYQSRYNTFSDNASRMLGARQVNETSFANDSTANLNQYQTRFNTFNANETLRLQAEENKWRREYDLARLGLDATTAGR